VVVFDHAAEGVAALLTVSLHVIETENVTASVSVTEFAIVPAPPTARWRVVHSDSHPERYWWAQSQDVQRRMLVERNRSVDVVGAETSVWRARRLVSDEKGLAWRSEAVLLRQRGRKKDGFGLCCRQSKK